jgi:hypothetical protein
MSHNRTLDTGHWSVMTKTPVNTASIDILKVYTSLDGNSFLIKVNAFISIVLNHNFIFKI